MQSKEPSHGLEGLSTQERRILGTFIAEELVVVRVEDLLAIHPVSREAGNLALSRLHQKGWLRRLKRGVYATVPLESETPHPAIADAWPLAMELFSPCYISGWSAAEHWDLTEQIFNAVSLVTGHPQRSSSQSISGVHFRTRTIAPERIFGTSGIWFGSHMVQVADRHRLLVDILDAPDFGGGGRHMMDVVSAYWRGEHADADTLLAYALRYGRGAVMKRLGFTAERSCAVSAGWLDKVESNLTKGVIRLDPQSGAGGRINSRWHVRVNIPLEAR